MHLKSHLVTCHPLTLVTQWGQIPTDQLNSVEKGLPDREGVLDAGRIKGCENDIGHVLLHEILRQKAKQKPNKANNQSGHFGEH